MGLPLIQDEELYPGDLVDVEYEIRDTANFLEDAAIASVKRELAKDPRWHYQGSKIETRQEAFGPVKILVITVQVADPSKVTGNHPPAPEQQAGLGGVTVALIVGAVATAVIAYSGALVYRGHVVMRIATDPNIPDDVKVAALNAMGKGPSVGAGLAALGGTVITLMVVLGALWLLHEFGHDVSLS